jgi:hypothetical protein
MEFDRQNTGRTCNYCMARLLDNLEAMDSAIGYRNAVRKALFGIRDAISGITDGCVAIVKARGDALIADLTDARMPEIHLDEVRHWLGVLASDMPDAEVDGNMGGDDA